MNYNVVAATNEDTVVATYEPSKVRSDSYQSEAELEKEFIRLLCEQGYTYLPLHTEDELIANLRSQLEDLRDAAAPPTQRSISSAPRPPRFRLSPECLLTRLLSEKCPKSNCPKNSL